MKTILNPFHIRLDTFLLAGTALTLLCACGLPLVKTALVPRFAQRREHRQRVDNTAISKPGAKVPVENPGNGQDEAFDVAIKFVRTSVRSPKSSKSGPVAGTTRVRPDRGQAGDSAL